MKTPIPIVIPLHHGGGKFKDDTELRITLRSLERHFKDPFEVVIVGRKLPKWLHGVRHLPCNKGLKTALKVAADAYPDGFFWHYDDCVLVSDTTAEEMKVTGACRVWRKAKTSWARKLETIHQRLVKEERPAFDYSRPHGPYWFDKSMVDEAFADWPGMEGKFPFESWILSKRDWPRRFGIVKQYYGGFNGPPGAGHFFLNWSDKGLTARLLKYLKERFSETCRFEANQLKSEALARGKVEVHTIRFGAPWWLLECSETLEDWCANHGHQLKVWNEGNIDPAYPTAKFCEVDMLREFLAGDSDWLFYVDADVYVSADAPQHPIPVGGAGFFIKTDRPSKFSRGWPKWVRQRISGVGKEADSWIYRNAGIWICDRNSAEILLGVIEGPYHEGCQEQHHFNWWLCHAATKGMVVNELPDGWNIFPYEERKGPFQHICGRQKAAKFNALLSAGIIQRKVWKSSASAFDEKKYHGGPADLSVEMDAFHTHLLRVACEVDTGSKTGGKVAVEIGSYMGRSTAALVDAVNEGIIDHLHIVEVRPRAELHRILALAKPGAVTLHTKPFWDTEIGAADIVFIDGDHKWPAVGDAMRAITWGAKVICMHDSQAWPRIDYCWGAHLAGRMLKDAPDRNWVEDAEDRKGSRTFRGFLVSAKAGIDLSPVRDFIRGAQ